MRQKIEAVSPWSEGWGYSRAVRCGSIIEIGGTTAAGADGHITGVNDPYEQARYVISTIIQYIEQLGGTVSNIVRTRVFLRNIDDWREVGRAHVELLGSVTPASSCLGGLDFLSPELLVEIEATAILDASNVD
jgi:enamine deaminase RidA (YjgF/YER057c/UK114 family)